MYNEFNVEMVSGLMAGLIVTKGDGCLDTADKESVVVGGFFCVKPPLLN